VLFIYQKRIFTYDDYQTKNNLIEKQTLKWSIDFYSAIVLWWWVIFKVYQSTSLK